MVITVYLDLCKAEMGFSIDGRGEGRVVHAQLWKEAGTGISRS
jgi:hypothetical protein